MKEYLDDIEFARFHRVSVRTVLKSVRKRGAYNGIAPKVVGGGNCRKYRMWSVEAIAQSEGISPERVAAAAVE